MEDPKPRTTAALRYASDYERLGEILASARREAGFRQEEVAEQMGWAQSWVSRVEKGKRRLDVIELRELAEIYGARIEDLIPERSARATKHSRS